VKWDSPDVGVLSRTLYQRLFSIIKSHIQDTGIDGGGLEVLAQEGVAEVVRGEDEPRGGLDLGSGVRAQVEGAAKTQDAMYFLDSAQRNCRQATETTQFSSRLICTSPFTGPM
jgi:hypothetical protein